MSRFQRPSPVGPRKRHLAAASAGVLLVAGVGGALALGSSSPHDAAPGSKVASRATVSPEHLESVVRYNGTDDDAQILFLAKDEEVPFAKFSIVAPNGRTVIANRTVGARDVGQSDANIRTSQHKLARIKRAFPPGRYRWKGEMLSGKRLAGTSRLAFGLLDPPVITSPAAGAQGVPVSGVRVEWKPVRGAEAIFVEVEDDTSARGRELLVRLDGDATSLEIPDQFLKPGTEYAVELKALAPNGNQSAADFAFETG